MNSLFERNIPVADHISYNIWDAVVSGILTFVCVLSFKPSVLAEVNFTQQLILSAIIAGVVFSVLLLKCYLVAKLFPTKIWTIKMDLLVLSMVFVAISLVLLALSPLVLKTWLQLPLAINLNYVITVVGFVHLVGFLLYFVSISARYIINGSSNQVHHASKVQPAEPSELTETETVPPATIIRIEGKNQGELVMVEKDALMCISTTGHYVEIFIEDQNSPEGFKKIVYRNSITSILDTLNEYEEFIQCHRSYLVNLTHVSSVKGGSKKMEMYFEKLPFSVPVSRPKIATIVEKLKKKRESLRLSHD